MFARIRNKPIISDEIAIRRNGQISGTLLKNSSFENGSQYWNYSKYESRPGCAVLEGVSGGNSDTILLKIVHSEPADSRITQNVTLTPNLPYSVSASLKIDNVYRRKKGAYLCVMGINGIESLELKGSSDWQTIEFIIINRAALKKTIEVAARLGGYGSMNTGSIRIRNFLMIPIQEIQENIPVYELH